MKRAAKKARKKAAARKRQPSRTGTASGSPSRQFGLAPDADRLRYALRSYLMRYRTVLTTSFEKGVWSSLAFAPFGPGLIITEMVTVCAKEGGTSCSEALTLRFVDEVARSPRPAAVLRIVTAWRFGARRKQLHRDELLVVRERGEWEDRLIGSAVAADSMGISVPPERYRQLVERAAQSLTAARGKGTLKREGTPAEGAPEKGANGAEPAQTEPAAAESAGSGDNRAGAAKKGTAPKAGRRAAAASAP